MDRIPIDIKDLKVNGNRNFALVHDATSLVKFEGGLTNPLAGDLCFALVFHKFDVGIVVEQKTVNLRRPLAHKLLTLGMPWFEAFSMPAEIIADDNTWNDWKSPLTKYVVLKHLEPEITIKPAVDGDKQSVTVHLNIRKEYPGGSVNEGSECIISLKLS